MHPVIDADRFLITTPVYEGEEFWLTFRAPKVDLIADTFGVSTDRLVGRVALEADAPIAQR